MLDHVHRPRGDAATERPIPRVVADPDANSNDTRHPGSIPGACEFRALAAPRRLPGLSSHRSPFYDAGLMTRDRSHRRGARPLASERLHSLILALACGSCAAHGTSVGVQSADLPVSQGPVAEGVVAAPIATTPDPHGSRIVPQVGFDPTSYQLTDPSGRFAVFDRVIVDLRSDRVAWLHEGGIIPVQTPENHLLRQHLEDTVGVELWDLLDGTTRLFPGTLVLHAPMAGRVALQRGPALDIIDVVQRQRVALLPALGEVLSVVPSADGWRILARTGTRREQPALVLLSTPPAPADGVKTLALELPSSRFSLAARSERSSDPFLVIGERGQLSVNVIESCAACPAPGQLSSWSSALDQRTGRGGPWSEKRFAATQSPGGALPLEGPHVRAGSAPMPASVQDHLGRLRTTPELGVMIQTDGDRCATAGNCGGATKDTEALLVAPPGGKIRF